MGKDASQLYNISRRKSDIRKNRDIDVLILSRNKHLFLGEWKTIYCSAENYYIHKIIFHDRYRFTIYIKAALEVEYSGTYIVDSKKIFFSMPDQSMPIVAEYEISDEILIIKSEIVNVMYVKNDGEDN